jgi:hypothetical protein
MRMRKRAIPDFIPASILQNSSTDDVLIAKDLPAEIILDTRYQMKIGQRS